MQEYKMIGVMSGTSLDGIDLAYCKFNFGREWKYELFHSETIPYGTEWKQRLSDLAHGTAEELSLTDCDYGKYTGILVRNFCEKNNITPDYVCSHGHTIFHQPDRGFTKQIGCGAFIAASCGYPVICDFRITDVANGGQGAPLVPVGDKFLFKGNDACLNLGGIANISFQNNGGTIAFDICACNIVLNYFAEKKGAAYDRDGLIAAGGKCNTELLTKINALSYYSDKKNKSLGREEIEKELLPVLVQSGDTVEDVLATFCFHIAEKVGNALKDSSAKKLLITGGGALNNFLVEKIAALTVIEILIPSKELIEFKEAIIFAFLGVLKLRGEANSLMSVTGAAKNSCGGILYYPA